MRLDVCTVERSSPEPRAFQKAGLIFRTNSFKNALAADKNLGTIFFIWQNEWIENFKEFHSAKNFAF